MSRFTPGETPDSHGFSSIGEAPGYTPMRGGVPIPAAASSSAMSYGTLMPGSSTPAPGLTPAPSDIYGNPVLAPTPLAPRSESTAVDRVMEHLREIVISSSVKILTERFDLKGVGKIMLLLSLEELQVHLKRIVKWMWHRLVQLYYLIWQKPKPRSRFRPEREDGVKWFELNTAKPQLWEPVIMYARQTQQIELKRMTWSEFGTLTAHVPSLKIQFELEDQTEVQIRSCSSVFCHFTSIECTSIAAISESQLYPVNSPFELIRVDPPFTEIRQIQEFVEECEAWALSFTVEDRIEDSDFNSYLRVVGHRSDAFTQTAVRNPNFRRFCQSLCYMGGLLSTVRKDVAIDIPESPLESRGLTGHLSQMIPGLQIHARVPNPENPEQLVPIQEHQYMELIPRVMRFFQLHFASERLTEVRTYQIFFKQTTQLIPAMEQSRPIDDASAATSAATSAAIPVGKESKPSYCRTVKETFMCEPKGRIRKTLETLYLPEDQKEQIRRRIELYRRHHEVKDLELPNRLGALISGPPGTGKTTCNRVLACELGKNIYYVNLGTVRTVSQFDQIIEYIKNQPGGGIIALEDFDVMTDIGLARASLRETKSDGGGEGDLSVDIRIEEDIERMHPDFKQAMDRMERALGGIPTMYEDTSAPLSLSHLLQFMDGTTSCDHIPIIITTNCPEDLDPALVRAGRIDIRLEMKNCTHSQLKQMYQRFFHREPTPEVLARFEEDHWPPVNVVNRLAEYRLQSELEDAEILKPFLT